MPKTPPTNPLAAYSGDLEALLDAHSVALSALGERVRVEVIAPFCREHRLTFTSAMGVFFFSRGDRNFDPAYGMPKGKLGSDIQRIYDLLNAPVTRDSCLGFYVGDAG
jgi:hypothetical protein